MFCPVSHFMTIRILLLQKTRCKPGTNWSLLLANVVNMSHLWPLIGLIADKDYTQPSQPHQSPVSRTRDKTMTEADNYCSLETMSWASTISYHDIVKKLGHQIIMDWWMYFMTSFYDVTKAKTAIKWKINAIQKNSVRGGYSLALVRGQSRRVTNVLKASILIFFYYIVI